MTNQWFSAKELAALNPRGLRIPGSERGCRNLAKREGWPSREVQGKGGRGGVLTLYRPPDALLAQIAALDEGVSIGSSIAEYETSASSDPLVSGNARLSLESSSVGSGRRVNGPLIKRSSMASSTEAGGSLRAEVLGASIALVMKIIQALDAATWLPSDVSTEQRNTLTVRTSNRLLRESNYNDQQLAPLVASSEVLDALLRLEWALMCLPLAKP